MSSISKKRIYEKLNGIKSEYNNKIIAPSVEFDCMSVDDIIEEALMIKNKFSNKYDRVYMERETEYSYGDTQICFYWMGERWETDEEYNIRVQKHNNEIEQTEKRELEEFNRLKAKFENKS